MGLGHLSPTNEDYIRIIKQTVRSGHTVYVGTTNYEVIECSASQWLIHSKFNDHYIGLHGDLEKGYGLNGREFFIVVGGHKINIGDFVPR
tara:strand:+ start:312 stop:581 length:270 start_codon:yes stop_codon:yes gene_type:complete